MLVVEPGGPEVAETATKPSQASLQKHCLGGCTIRMLPPIRTAVGGVAYRFVERCLVDGRQ